MTTRKALLGLLALTALSGSAGAVTHAGLNTSFYQAHGRRSACGATRGAWAQVAVSRDLVRALPCGTRVRVSLQRPTGGVRSFTAVVWDRLGPGANRSVDVLVGHREPARNFGRTRATVRVLARP